MAAALSLRWPGCLRWGASPSTNSAGKCCSSALQVQNSDLGTRYSRPTHLRKLDLSSRVSFNAFQSIKSDSFDPNRTFSPDFESKSFSHRSSTTCRAASFSAVPDNGFPIPETFEDEKPNLWTILRAICFYIVTYLLAIPLFIYMLLIHPFVVLFDKFHRKLQHAANNIWANLSTSLFYKIEVEGWENLPGQDEPAVYVSNHLSYLDIFTLFKLNRNFKYISKISIFYIPIVGWSMFLTGHIPLKRTDKRSQMECLKKCLDLLKIGAPVLFFPEGTRSKSGKLDEFKKGAFTLAVKSNRPVVPITILGTRKLMPSGKEYSLGTGSVKLVIHPPLQGNDADELCSKARKAIAGTLIQHGYQVL